MPHTSDHPRISFARPVLLSLLSFGSLIVVATVVIGALVYVGYALQRAS